MKPQLTPTQPVAAPVPSQRELDLAEKRRTGWLTLPERWELIKLRAATAKAADTAAELVTEGKAMPKRRVNPHE